MQDGSCPVGGTESTHHFVNGQTIYSAITVDNKTIIAGATGA